MIWVVCGIVAIGVLAAAAFAGTGRFGQMPAEPVTDRPRGFVPEGPIDKEFLRQARLPTALSGYSRSEVDRYLREVSDGSAAPADETLFDVTRGGYDMQVVDELLTRERYERPTAATPGGDPFVRPEQESPEPEDAAEAPDEPEADEDTAAEPATAAPTDTPAEAAPAEEPATEIIPEGIFRDEEPHLAEQPTDDLAAKAPPTGEFGPDDDDWFATSHTSPEDDFDGAVIEASGEPQTGPLHVDDLATPVKPPPVADADEDDADERD